MSLYLKSGYLNIPWVEEQADRNNISFIVCIGSRQIGKTYGTLKLMLDNDRRFILMRRTQTECEFLSNKTLNPFQSLGRPDIEIKKDSDYTGSINLVTADGVEQIGLTTSLKGISKIRGFSGSLYTDLVYDEFIPENHVSKIKDEGSAFINALITISGNRELENKKPLRTWLLANSNNINSPILESLNISKKIEQMSNTGKEYSLLRDRGIIIILAKAQEVVSKRKKTSLMRAINSEESQVVKMAFNNEFSYNDAESVKNVDLRNYKLIASIIGELSLWQSKQNGDLHVTSYRKSNNEFTANDRGKKEFILAYPDLKIYYLSNKTTYANLLIKEKYKEIICVN